MTFTSTFKVNTYSLLSNGNTTVYVTSSNQPPFTKDDFTEVWTTITERNFGKKLPEAEILSDENSGDDFIAHIGDCFLKLGLQLKPIR